MLILFIILFITLLILWFITTDAPLFNLQKTTASSPTTTPTSTPTPKTIEQIPTQDMELINTINNYRKSINLNPIPVSNDAWKVSSTHIDDLVTNKPGCSPHSWSDQPGKWTGCCYDVSKPNGPCMWSKPKEITGNSSRGYEISGGGVRNSDGALKMWLNSELHKNVIENKGMWTNMKWTGLGCSLKNNYTCCWFLD